MIVSKQRSGTNHFVSLLKSHPQIACYGEVFRDGYRVTDLIGPEFAHYLPINARTSDPNRFLDDLEAFVQPEAEMLGFKVFPSQFVPVTQIAHRENLKIIRLVRRNLLATYSSSRIAQATGQGVARANEEVRKAKVDFDAKDFERFMRSQGSLDSQVDAALAHIPEDRVFHLEYSQLNDEPKMESLLEFLGAAPQPMTSHTQKRNPSKIVDRFNNPDAAMAYLKSKGLTDWAEES